MITPPDWWTPPKHILTDDELKRIEELSNPGCGVLTSEERCELQEGAFCLLREHRQLMTVVIMLLGKAIAHKIALGHLEKEIAQLLKDRQ